MFNSKKLQAQEKKITHLTTKINELATENWKLNEKIKNSEEIIRKLDQQQRKAEKLFIDALNEQRLKISQSIEVIKYLCSKCGVKLIKKEETTKKTTKKGK